MSNRKPNPLCPVLGCDTDKPHTDDPVVLAMLQVFSQPKDLAYWSLAAMVDLRNSMIADMDANRLFAWQTRLRQVEEIYIRALYVLFIAESTELPHIISGELPNSIVRLYREVNSLVFEGRGNWETPQQGEAVGQYTPLQFLHSSAHASYSAMHTAILFARYPEETQNNDGYLKHLDTYCDRLHYMHEMFKAGKSKEDVLGGMISMHRPASYWTNL
ncbi:hypothetical protein [Tunturiibacter gelidiferens]|uniref:hypothetical protein n=1 Tax=Tunturiibacter gelidiferens TaxID=3069689 RepID=UPI003D9BB01F